MSSLQFQRRNRLTKSRAIFRSFADLEQAGERFELKSGRIIGIPSRGLAPDAKFDARRVRPIAHLKGNVLAARFEMFAHGAKARGAQRHKSARAGAKRGRARFVKCEASAKILGHKQQNEAEQAASRSEQLNPKSDLGAMCRFGTRPKPTSLCGSSGFS